MTLKGPEIKIGNDYKFVEYIEIIKIANKSSKEVVKAIGKLEKKFGRKCYEKIKTITFDNGGEFRKYEDIERARRKEGKRFTIYYVHTHIVQEDQGAMKTTID